MKTPAEIITWVLAALVIAIVAGVYIVIYLTFLPFIVIWRFAKFVARDD